MPIGKTHLVDLFRARALHVPSLDATVKLLKEHALRCLTRTQTRLLNSRDQALVTRAMEVIVYLMSLATAPSCSASSRHLRLDASQKDAAGRLGFVAPLWIFTFPHDALCRRRRGQRGRKRDKPRWRGRLVKRCKDFLKGRWQDLQQSYTSDNNNARAKTRPSSAPATAPEAHKAHALHEALLDNDYCEARRIITSNGVAQLDDDVVGQLKQKHPAADHPFCVPDSDLRQKWVGTAEGTSKLPAALQWLTDSDATPPHKLDAAFVERALLTMNARASPGPDMLPPCLLALAPREDARRAAVQKRSLRQRTHDEADPTSGDPSWADSSTITSSLAAVVRNVITANLASDLRQLYSYNRLIPLRKSARPEDRDVRPIGISSALRRLAGRTLTLAYSNHWGSILESFNTGTGLRGGQESCPHRVRAYLRDHPGHALLSLDSKNAFNSIDRREINVALEEHCPELLPYFQTLYGLDTTLILADGNTITASRGVTQGDACGPALFNLGQHRVLLRFMESLRDEPLTGGDILVQTLHDDSYLLGPPAALKDALKRLERLMAEAGLELQPSKSILYLPQNDATRPASEADTAAIADLKKEMKFTEEGTVVVGTPVGTPEYETQVVMERVRDLRSYLELINPTNATSLLHGQTYLAWHLFRLTAPGRLTHWLRGVHPAHTKQPAEEADSLLQGFLADILGIAKEELTEREKLIFHEYTEKGGLGILPRARARHGAYLGSLLLTARDWRRSWEKQIMLRRSAYSGAAAPVQLHQQDIPLLRACYYTYCHPQGQVACLLRRAQRFLTENMAGSLSEVLDANSAHMTQVILDLLRGTQNGRLIFSIIPDPGHLTLESLVYNEQPLFPPPLTSPHAFRPPSGAPAPRGSSPDSGAALVLSLPSGVQAGQNAGQKTGL
jgi:hypothetical protein